MRAGGSRGVVICNPCVHTAFAPHGAHRRGRTECTCNPVMHPHGAYDGSMVTRDENAPLRNPWLRGSDADARRDELLLAMDAVLEAGGMDAVLDAVVEWTDIHRDECIDSLAGNRHAHLAIRALHLDARRSRSPTRRSRPRTRPLQR